MDPVEQVISQSAEVDSPAPQERIVFEDQIMLQNGHVHVAVSPRAGRIVAFGPAGGRNLLWINTPPGDTPYQRDGRPYINFGGDKIWPLVQSLWPRAYSGPDWPPEGVLDGQPWELVDHGKHHVVMQSPLSPHLGIRIHREIRLSPVQGRVVIHNRLIQEQPTLYPVTIWSISQVYAPPFSLLDIAPDRPIEQPWVKLSNTLASDRVQVADDRSWVRFDYVAGEGQKIGTLGHWVAGAWEDYVFIQTTHYDPTAAYLDGSSIQVYYDENYLELELLSPSRHLQPGQSLANTVNWWLIPRKNMDAQAIAQRAEALVVQTQVEDGNASEATSKTNW